MCLSISDFSSLGIRRFGAPRRLLKTEFFLRFFLVDLSRRKVVILRGVRFGKARAESSRTLPLPPSEPFRFYDGLVPLLSVPSLVPAVVPRAGAVVPLGCYKR